MTTPKIGLRDVVVERGGRRVLDVPELDVLPGEVLAVLGPNGAGKSTLIQVLALLDRPAAGEVLLDGESARGNPLPFRRRMAVVFQESLLLDTTVESNVASGLMLRGAPAGERKARARHWLERFGIAGLARRPARALSGGEAQRASLARAFVLEPEVLLLDEPFSSLDEPTRQALLDDLDRALGETGTTVVFVTHDRAEALRLGDRVAVIMDGRIRQVGEPAQVFAQPADEQVAAFLGVETIVPGRICRQQGGLAQVEVAAHNIEAATELSAGVEVLFCLRPEDIVLSPADENPSPTSARNRLSAVVRRIVNVGPQVRVDLDAGFPLAALITKQSLEELSLEAGSRVMVSFKATAVHLIPRHSR